jgi:uncharacterized protein YbjT (DUF2867 family)
MASSLDTRGLLAVTGATGAVGTRIAFGLAAAGIRQRLVVRSAVRAPQIPGSEICLASGYGSLKEMRAALEGANTVFLIPAAETTDRVEQHRTAVDAAVQAGIERMVYLSFFRAAPDATFTLARDHWHTEQHIRDSPMRWTFLRMNLYMDFIPTMVGADGTIRGPAGDGRVAAILRDDVARAAVAVLTSEGHDGHTYDLSGPKAFSLSEAAAVMSEASGRSIRYHDETDDEAYTSRAGLGADFEIQGWVSSYQAIRDGSLQAVSSDVRELTGEGPVALGDYLRAHPEAFEHVD